MKKKMVIDASVAVSFLLPDEKFLEEAKNLLAFYDRKEVDFYAPPLLDYEVVNAIKTSVVSGRTKEKDIKKIMKTFSGLRIEKVSVDLNLVLEIAIKYKLSVYDACYLALAKIRKMPLLTFDKKLKKISEKRYGL